MNDSTPPDTERDTRPSVWDGSELPPTARLIVDMSDRVLSMNERVAELQTATGEARDSARQAVTAVGILAHDVSRIRRTVDDMATAIGEIARAVGVELPPPLRLVGGDHGAE